MNGLEQFIGPLASALVGGIAAYVAIRSDLADLKARMTLTEKSASEAHGRIDSLLMKK